ncbi:MAG: sugar ABC transporter permease [Planctomycetes bacterium]|nr:sugar ABC transporter permease [Planctomycetota bacterium]
MQRNELKTGLTLISPWLIGFLALTLFPFLASLYWSFCEYDMLGSPRWVGLRNYRRLAAELADGGTFARALANTAYYAVVSVSLSVVMGITLAVSLSQKVRGRAIYRSLCFLPSVVPLVAASVLWMWLLDPQQGLVNGVLQTVHLPAQNWFQSTSSALWPSSWPADHMGRVFGSKDGLVLMSLWGIGNLLIIYLAALGDIPKGLYEAAELDGAGRVRQFLHITLPMLTPVIFFNVVMGLIQSVQAFTQIYLVSDGRGDPAGSTLTLSMHLFLTAFKDLDMGYASAMAWVMFVLVMLVTIWLFRTSRHWVHH